MTIAGDIVKDLSFEDVAKNADFDAPETQRMLGIFLSHLIEWRANLDPGVMNVRLCL